MHKFHHTLIVTLCGIALLGSRSIAQYPSQIKIMTYNIQAENATHTGGDYSDIATVIKAIKPAICGMQKVDSVSAAKPVDVLKYLGEQTTMVPVFSMSYKKGTGGYGNGFLSDSVPKSIRHLAIAKGSGGEDRSALEIGITMSGERVRVIVTHLAYENDAARVPQIQQILPWIDAGGAATDPVVIMADFNAKPTENAMKLFTDAGFIFVKGKNGSILDTSTQQGINHILYRPAASWTIVDAGNPKYAASNRNPVWADMKLIPVAAAPVVDRKHSVDLQLLFAHGTFHYDLTNPATVSLRLYNASGKLVRAVIENNLQKVGHYAITVADRNLPAGCYHCILSIDGRRYGATTAIVR